MKRLLIYVSRQILPIAGRDNAIEAMVAQARWLNFQAGITGALICTPTHFAQLIEGPSVPLADLMQRIERDKRHTHVAIVRDTAIEKRVLPDWSLAYSGSSTFIESRVLRIIEAETKMSSFQVDDLAQLIVEFTLN